MDSIPITSLINKRSLGFDPNEQYDFDQIYAHLKQLAKIQKVKIKGQSINTTMLVNEAWLKLKGNNTYNNRNHFFAVCSIAMKHILINESKRAKRVVAAQTLIDGESDTHELQDDLDWMIDLEKQLHNLNRRSERLEQVFVYRFFGGMSNAEIAEVLGVNVRTIDRDWRSAMLMISCAMQLE